MSVDYPKWDYEEYPKTLARDDYWGQVRRTVLGRPVSDSDMAVIVAAIDAALALHEDDRVLDLACGNGALSSRLFSKCSALLGVDSSEYLIEIAQETFARPGYKFQRAGAADFVASASDPQRFSKVLCYGSFSYFSSDEADRVLASLHRRFIGVSRVFLGNLPDRERAALFFGRAVDDGTLDAHRSQIGVWRTAAQVRDLAGRHGWSAEIRRMPGKVFNAGYRFDALLMRA
jgi:cyclopropane fatty-acyl-phospholipid synthase-like methyltransferase